VLLRLPGHGEHGPLLEVMQYDPPTPRADAALLAPGYGHVAFEVDDVEGARRRVVAAGGSPVAGIVTVPYPAGGRLSWCYVRDPEGNVVELQSFGVAPTA
jgi:catechol 2,3-dioxygenase-like lactoylglutathione lyase family enzyme